MVDKEVATPLRFVTRLGLKPLVSLDGVRVQVLEKRAWVRINKEAPAFWFIDNKGKVIICVREGEDVQKMVLREACALSGLPGKINHEIMKKTRVKNNVFPPADEFKSGLSIEARGQIFRAIRNYETKRLLREEGTLDDGASPSVGADTTKPLRVLVVDDEKEIRREKIKILRKIDKKLIILEAIDESDAINKMRAGKQQDAPIDFVFTDLNMPCSGGHQLKREAAKEFPGTPVILVSSGVQSYHSKYETEKGFYFIINNDELRKYAGFLLNCVTRSLSLAKVRMIFFEKLEQKQASIGRKLNLAVVQEVLKDKEFEQEALYIFVYQVSQDEFHAFRANNFDEARKVNDTALNILDVDAKGAKVGMRSNPRKLVSRWHWLEQFKQQIGGIPEEAVEKLRGTHSMGEAGICRRISLTPTIGLLRPIMMLQKRERCS
ncbi:MAG: response regulator [Candidatus Omnitrophica bacterium]|nr:response regulator [Candidatus Omnitrophota bacterium]